MRQIAVLTSGGDAPGMNAAIRAVVRAGIGEGWRVFGVRDGFAGLINGELVELPARAVGGILQRGGTMLGSARSKEFHTEAGQRTALRQLNQWGIDGLVVIGGNGSQTGASVLSNAGFPVVGVASTIDNDLMGSDITIGTDTALNIALESIDRLRTTASSHNRAFLVEVMGRDCGYLALMAGLAGGAEAVVVPEFPTDCETLLSEIEASYMRGKAHSVIVVAEGAKPATEEIAAYMAEHRERAGFDVRATILGHVQRGGDPTAFDRNLATRLGAGAVAALARGEYGVLVGIHGNQVGTSPYSEIVGKQKPLDPEMIKLAKIMAR